MPALRKSRPSPHAYSLLFLLALLTAAVAAHAQAIPQPQLVAAFPMGGRAGSEFELSVVGQLIDGDLALYFSHPGITATPVMLKANRFYPADRPAPGRFIVHIAGDVPIGSYEVRVSTRHGLSNARVFMVDRLAEFSPEQPAVDPAMSSGRRRSRRESSAPQPPKSNSDAATAMAVSVESIINGACTAQHDDYYKFTAKKGQRLILHCTAQEADSRADVVLDLYDAAGKHLQVRHDPARLDPTLDFTVPADGEYVVAVHDFLYRGGPEFGYRLAITAGPWIDYIDPPFATPGAKSSHVLYGRNLPGSTTAGVNGADGRPLEKLAVNIAAPGEDAAPAADTLMRRGDASIATFSWRLQSPRGVSNPVRIALANGSRLTEEEPNDTPETAQALTLPAQIVGRFYPRNDRDWYSFTAHKGDKLWIEVISQRLGLPTDPWFMVQREVPAADGKPATFADVAEADDQLVRQVQDDQRLHTVITDPAMAFIAPQDGSYRILVKDLYGSGQSEPRFFYLLSVRAAQPDFRLMACYARLEFNDGGGRPSTAVLRKGARVEIDVVAFRREGFDGEIELSAEGLPPGVSVEPAVVGPSLNEAHLVLRANKTAPDWIGSIRVVGKARINGADVIHPALANEVLAPPEQNTNFSPSRISPNFALSVRGDVPVPFTIDTGEARICAGLPRGGKIKVPVKILPGDGPKAAPQLNVIGLPQLVRPISGQQFTADASGKPLELDIDPTAPPGVFSFVLLGESTFPYIVDADLAKRVEQDRKRIEMLVQQANSDSQSAQQKARQADQALQDAKAKLAQLTQQHPAQKQQAEAAVQKQHAAASAVMETQAASDKAEQELTAAQKAGEAKALEKARKTADKAKESLDKAIARATDQKAAAQAAADAVKKSSADSDAAAKKVKSAEEESKSAQEKESEARDFAQQAESARRSAERRAQALSDLGRPRNSKFILCSAPIRVEIVADPFKLTMKPDTIELQPGATPVDLQVALARDFGFDDEVRFEIQLPPGASGIRLSDAKNKIAKGAAAATVALQADKYATPGTFPCLLRARYQLNNRGLTMELPLEVKVVGGAKK